MLILFSILLLTFWWMFLGLIKLLQQTLLSILNSIKFIHNLLKTNAKLKALCLCSMVAFRTFKWPPIVVLSLVWVGKVGGRGVREVMLTSFRSNGFYIQFFSSFIGVFVRLLHPVYSGNSFNLIFEQLIHKTCWWKLIFCIGKLCKRRGVENKE